MNNECHINKINIDVGIFSENLKTKNDNITCNKIEIFQFLHSATRVPMPLHNLGILLHDSLKGISSHQFANITRPLKVENLEATVKH